MKDTSPKRVLSRREGGVFCQRAGATPTAELSRAGGCALLSGATVIAMSCLCSGTFKKKTVKAREKQAVAEVTRETTERRQPVAVAFSPCLPVAYGQRRPLMKPGRCLGTGHWEREGVLGAHVCPVRFLGTFGRERSSPGPEGGVLPDEVPPSPTNSWDRFC